MNVKKLIVFAMLVLFGLVGCGKLTNTSELSELLTYKNSYVGDNSAVSHILWRLPAHEYLDGFELQTSQEPYEITINYKNFDKKTVKLDDDSTSNASLNEILKSNAMIILSLIKNAEIVNFNVEGHDMIIFDRATLSNSYGNTLDSITEDESSLQNFIKTYTNK